LKKDRALIFAFNYGGSPWVDQRSIEAEASALAEANPAEAERFFGNRIVAGSGAWFDMTKWADRKVEPITVTPRTKVCAGFDGSNNDDHTGIRLETLDGYQFTPTYGDARRRTHWRPQDWDGRIPRAEVMAAWSELASDFEIVRAYLDPAFWESEADTLAAEHGDKVFLKWACNRLNPMHAALERFRTDVYNVESDFQHDGDVDVEAHLRNAILRARGADPATGINRYFIGKPTDPQKIDLAMTSVLAHEARMDAIADGALTERPDNFIYY
jgi:hypothetical protein